DVRREADAVVLTPLPASFLAGAQLVVATEIERALEAALVIAGVVDNAGSGRVRKFGRLREITAANFRRVEIQIARRDVNDALDKVCGFRAAGAAIGVGGHLVGEDAERFEFDSGNLVAAGAHETGERSNNRRQQLMVSAEISEHAGAHAEDFAILPNGELDIVDLVAAVNGGGDILAARLRPLH